MPPPKRASTGTAVDMEESDDEMNSGSRRRSTRTPKPVVRKSLRDASDSEGEGSDSGSDIAPVRKGAKKGGGKRPGVVLPKTKKPQKKARREDDSDAAPSEDEMEDSEEESETETPKRGKPASKSPATNGKKADESDDDDGELDIHLEDPEVDDPDWAEPDYTDKDWFKENCLLCQICNKKYKKTGDALECFHKHKDNMRCYICFTVLKGGKDGTKRLFKHYQNRHKRGGKPNTLQCPHCKDTFAYKSMSCHIISTHFRQALGIPDKAKEEAAAARQAAKEKIKAAAAKTNEKKKPEESDEEVEEEEEEEDNLKKRKVVAEEDEMEEEEEED